MHKLVFFPVLLVAACVVAAAYGAIHNQISYTVSPLFFFYYQFGRFDIPMEMWNRTGATLVGILATWWMGLVIGIPVFLLAPIIPGWKAYVKHSLIAVLLVVAHGAWRSGWGRWLSRGSRSVWRHCTGRHHARLRLPRRRSRPAGGDCVPDRGAGANWACQSSPRLKG